jgi:hypothetical protein
VKCPLTRSLLSIAARQVPRLLLSAVLFGLLLPAFQGAAALADEADPAAALAAGRQPAASRSAGTEAQAVADVSPEGAAIAGQVIGPRVVRSDEDGVQFRLEGLQPGWRERSLRGGSLQLSEPVLPGFVNAGSPSRPALPQRGWTILVPPGRRPVLAVVAEEWVTIPPRRLMVEPTPVLIHDVEADRAVMTEEVLLPGEEPSRGERAAVMPGLTVPQEGFGGSAARLGEVTTWRGRRIVTCTIQPLQADGQGLARRYLRSGAWEVRFVPDERAAVPGGGSQMKADSAGPGAIRWPAKRTTRGDDRFPSFLLNGDQLARWPTEAAAGTAVKAEPAVLPPGVHPGGSAELLAPEVKIPIRRTRLYRITAAGMRAQGLLPAGDVLESNIRLYLRRYSSQYPPQPGEPPYIEIEVPIKMMGEGDAFSGDDFFLFWGLRPRDDAPYTIQADGSEYDLPGSGDPHENYNGANIYWLGVAEPPSGETWARMREDTLPAASGPPLATYRRVDYFEENLAYRQQGIDHDGDRNFWNSFEDVDVSVRLPIFAADTLATNDQIRLGLDGFNDSPSHRYLEVYLENSQGTTLLDTVDVNRLHERILPVPLTGAQLAGRDISIRVQRPGGVIPLISHLNWLELSYDALYRTRDDTLLFHAGDEVGLRDVEVRGFRRAGLGLVEITDPRHPVWIALSGTNVRQEGDERILSLQIDQPAGRRTFFTDSEMSGSGVPEIVYYRCEVDDGDNPLAVAGPAPDLIVITHPDFRQACQRWVDYRSQHSGIAAHVVAVADVFDYFSGGLKDPWGIKRFVQMAIANWGSWALQIVGDGNENARGFGEPGPGSPYYNLPTDWVPTHLHLQDVGGSYAPEYLMSDKWFATSAAGPNYPYDTAAPSDMYVGRFPCNSVAALDAMIDKTIAFEDVQPNQQWRRRGIFCADDAWSFRYGNIVADTLQYKSVEEGFQQSEDEIAGWWEQADLSLNAERFFLSTYLDPFLEPGQTLRHTVEFRGYTAQHALPALLSQLTEGALFWHYQGHASAKLLAHEILFIDDYNDRRDVNALQNGGRPWVFYGMGCHISDWGQNTARAAIVEPSLAEKLLWREGSGAVATYASTGYEYLTDNSRLSEFQLQRYLSPPLTAVSGVSLRTRWILGELCWAAEDDALSVSGHGREMAGQFGILGDALLIMDAGPPQITAVLTDADNDTLSGDRDLRALDASNVRQLQVTAVDEAGIDRLVLRSEPDGASLNDHVTEIPEPGSQTQQRMSYAIELPLRPFDHTVLLEVYDAAHAAGSAPYAVRLRVPQTATFFLDGEPVEAGEIPFEGDQPLHLSAEVNSAAWLDPTWQKQLLGEGLTLEDVNISQRDEHTLGLSFTAVPVAGTATERSVQLVIDGYSTTYLLGDTEVVPTGVAIEEIYAYPNPMAGRTRFVFRTVGTTGLDGRVLVYSLAGRQVAEIPIRRGQFLDGGSDGVIPWDGRDGQGGDLANGVYLYRVELNGPAGRVDTAMQRLVIMR